MNWINRIRKSILYIFITRKPVIREINCIDLVIGNKLLFLIAWEAKYFGKLIIRPGKFKYKKTSGAAIVTLRPGTREVILKFSNFWRSNKIWIPLKFVELDQESFNRLTSDLEIFTTPNIVNLIPPEIFVPMELKSIEPQIKFLLPYININPQFNYQNLNRYEP